jgi:hypothetical protein
VNLKDESMPKLIFSVSENNTFNVVDLEKENYQKYLSIDILAFNQTFD